MPMIFVPPEHDCPLCPRLAGFREANRLHYPSFFNGPVPSFGGLSAELLVVGLAPGLKGANQTGRPFTGDYAGLVLYSSLKKHGLAAGEYDPEKLAKTHEQSADGFHLLNCRITNSVRCVPQQNKPETNEIRTCNTFLTNEIKAMPNLKAVLTLGQIAHKAVLMAFGMKQSAFAFGHGNQHEILREGAGSHAAFRKDPAPVLHAPQDGVKKIILFNSYHCSRYNINTGALTQEMFDAVVKRARAALG